MFTYKSTNSNSLFTISWYKDTELLCSATVKLKGNDDGIDKAITQAAQNLRKNNATLFNEEITVTEEDF